MRISPIFLNIAIVFSALTIVNRANAITIVPGFDTYTLPATDDGSTGEVSVPFALNFFGTTYNNLYVNNNGNLTLNSPQGSYTPYGLGASYTGQPIIAPFFADVDTTGGGSGLVAYGAGTYSGHSAFGVSYPGVGYYGGHTDKLDTFQVILTDRSDVAAGDFDIYFNYQKIQWETGDASGGVDGLGGTSAAAGYSAGSGMAGTYYQLAGSLVNGALLDGGPNSLVAGTNDGISGQYEFFVRNGAVTVSTVPLPATLPLLGATIAGLGAIRWRKARRDTQDWAGRVLRKPEWVLNPCRHGRT